MAPDAWSNNGSTTHSVVGLIDPAPFATLRFTLEDGGRFVSLTIDEVRHIAALARIGMSDQELEQMRDEMAHILENFDVLSEVDTEGVEPTGHSVDLNTVMRKDSSAESSGTDEILANAPLTEGDLIRIRAVLE